MKSGEAFTENREDPLRGLVNNPGERFECRPEPELPALRCRKRGMGRAVAKSLGEGKLLGQAIHRCAVLVGEKTPQDLEIVTPQREELEKALVLDPFLSDRPR